MSMDQICTKILMVDDKVGYLDCCKKKDGTLMGFYIDVIVF